MEDFYSRMLVALRNTDKERMAFIKEFKKIKIEKDNCLKNGFIGFGTGVLLTFIVLGNMELIIDLVDNGKDFVDGLF